MDIFVQDKSPSQFLEVLVQKKIEAMRKFLGNTEVIKEVFELKLSEMFKQYSKENSRKKIDLKNFCFVFCTIPYFLRVKLFYAMKNEEENEVRENSELSYRDFVKGMQTLKYGNALDLTFLIYKIVNCKKLIFFPYPEYDLVTYLLYVKNGLDPIVKNSDFFGKNDDDTVRKIILSSFKNCHSYEEFFKGIELNPDLNVFTLLFAFLIRNISVFTDKLTMQNIKYLSMVLNS